MALKTPPRRLVYIVVDKCHFCNSQCDSVRQHNFLNDYYTGWSFCSNCEDKVFETNKFWEDIYINMSIGAFGYTCNDEIKIERSNGAINIGYITNYELILSKSNNRYKICVGFKDGKEMMVKTVSFSQFLKHNPPKKIPIKRNMISNFMTYAQINNIIDDNIFNYKETLEEISNYFE